MKIEYIVLEDGVIQYVDGNKLVSIPPDPANSDYQAYLAAQSTPNEL